MPFLYSARMLQWRFTRNNPLMQLAFPTAIRTWVSLQAATRECMAAFGEIDPEPSLFILRRLIRRIVRQARRGMPGLWRGWSAPRMLRSLGLIRRRRQELSARAHRPYRRDSPRWRPSPAVRNFPPAFNERRRSGVRGQVRAARRGRPCSGAGVNAEVARPDLPLTCPILKKGGPTPTRRSEPRREFGRVGSHRDRTGAASSLRPGVERRPSAYKEIRFAEGLSAPNHVAIISSRRKRYRRNFA